MNWDSITLTYGGSALLYLRNIKPILGHEKLIMADDDIHPKAPVGCTNHFPAVRRRGLGCFSTLKPRRRTDPMPLPSVGHGCLAARTGEDFVERLLQALVCVGDNNGGHHEPPCVHVGETRVRDRRCCYGLIGMLLIVSSIPLACKSTRDWRKSESEATGVI